MSERSELFDGDLSILRETLDNGLRLVAAPRPSLHTAAIGVFIQVGSRHENKSNNGISHFLEHMLFRGTARHRSTHLLNLAIEELERAPTPPLTPTSLATN